MDYFKIKGKKYYLLPVDFIEGVGTQILKARKETEETLMKLRADILSRGYHVKGGKSFLSLSLEQINYLEKIYNEVAELPF